jgi:dolichol-phosphate mannosyltransferase
MPELQPVATRAIVVTPTYNERENVEALVRRIQQSAPGVDILIVDDNSPDGTAEIAERLRAEFPGVVHLLRRAGKQGLGPAYVAGFRYALEHGYDIILQMDADLSHDPSYLPMLLDAVEHCDLVLGSRYLRGINVVNWDFKRLLLSKAASKYVQFVTGMPYTDSTGGFKCWRRQSLESIGLDGVFSNGYLFQIEMTYKAFVRKLRIVEVPIIFYERRLGRSKIDRGIIWEAFWGVLRLKLRQ